ncbi:hypothetical protein EDB19DRAFT_1905072 [Suillus lakei]|nr:hypothetical protein EDB19DRAFT_1905072 [Suillus lakei]
MIKKPPVRAKQWQLDILKKMHAEEARPSASQRHKLAVETGLDEPWIRNWFIRKNRGSRAPPRPGGPLMCIIKLDPPEPDNPTYFDASRSQGPSSHPVTPQGTSDIPPTLDSLLASANGQVDQNYPTQRLAPRYILPHSVEPRSLSYTPDARPALAIRFSSRSSYLSFGEESTLPQNTRKWRYSRDPLHNRYPDFSKFFLPTFSDTTGDAAKTPEFSPIAMSPLTHNPSSIDAALRLSPDFSSSFMQLHSSITMPVFFSASLSLLHTMQAQDARDSTSPDC